MNVSTLTYPESQTKKWIPLDLTQIFNIVLHHPQAVTASPDDINNWHLANGWGGGAGYNEYIRKDGTVYIMRGDHIGAQCQGHNSTSYGICAEGDYSKELLMPEVQKNALIERIIFNKARFRNYKTTVPHWYFTGTLCPGKYFPISEILRKIEVKKKMFNDEEKISDYALVPVEKLKTLGIFSGDTDGNFRPLDPITRQDMAVVIYNLLKIKSL